MAVAKGAVSFEKHVGVATENWPLNAYSSNLLQTTEWLSAAESAVLACGANGHRYEPSELERSSLLSLQRGVFPQFDIEAGESLTEENVYFAFPPEGSQLTAADFSKYSTITARQSFFKDKPIMKSEVEISSSKDALLSLAKKSPI